MSTNGESISEELMKNHSFFCSLVHTNGFTCDHRQPLRILLFAESFPSFTSGITRRFKEIIRRLAKRKHRIHVITGCKVNRSRLSPAIVYLSPFDFLLECSIVDRRK